MSEGSALIITPSSDDDGPASGKTRQEAEDMHQDMVEEAGLFDLGIAVDNTDPQTREQQRPLDTQSPSTILQDSSIIHNSAMKPQAQKHTMLPANTQQHRGYTQTPVITSPGSTSQTFNISVDWPWEGSNMGSFRPEQTNSNIGEWWYPTMKMAGERDLSETQLDRSPTTQSS
jgi:hypothetical protein